MHQYRFFAKIKLKISMNFEDGFNQKLWRVLQKLKNYYILNDNNLPICYEIRLFPVANNNLTSQDECNLLKSLNESKVIHIYKRQIKDSFCVVVFLDVLQPKFNEIYRKYKHYQLTRVSLKNQNQNETREYSDYIKKQHLLYFPINYLNQEIKRDEWLLKHFMKAGAISYTDYRYIKIIFRTIRKLIYESVNNSKRKNHKRQKLAKDNIYEKGGVKFSSQDYKKENEKTKPKEEKQPVPITGKIEVSGLSEGLKALRAKEPITTEPKFPFKIPAGTHWNNVIIKFINDEEIEIHVKKLKHTTNYKEMGMLGKGKVPEPSEQWLFMKVLAQCNGEIAIKDPEAKDKYKKQKQALTEILRNYFSIDYDPFYPYKSCIEKGGNSYKIKILLIPPVVKKNIRPIITDEETDPLGIQEYLNNQMVNR
jgi:hypothetical protein